MSRQEANKEIAKMISDAVEIFPTLRMGQILAMLRVVTHTRPVRQKTADDYDIGWRDEFYLESEELLIRMRSTKNDYEG